MISLSLPARDSDSTKDLIVRVLSQEWPLSGKEIYSRVSRNYGKNISYQAVQKQVAELVERKVLLKAPEGFLLNIEWLDLTKKSSEDLLKKYNSFSNFNGEQFSVILNSSYDCDKFLLSLIARDLPKDDSKPFLSLHWNHFWVPLLFSVKEYFIVKSVFSLYSNYAISASDTLVDKWCANYWGNHGIKKILLGVPLPTGRDLVICGDTVVEILYPKELIQKIDEFYKSVKDIKDLNLNKLFEEIFLMPVKIPVIVTKNKELAEKLKKETLDLFGEAHD